MYVRDGFAVTKVRQLTVYLIVLQRFQYNMWLSVIVSARNRYGTV